MLYDETRLQAVSVIEAFRAGVPTRLSTRLLSDLRPEISAAIKADLEELGGGEAPKGRLIWGQYGQGKTHALISAGYLALDMGFAVSSVTLSREVSCHNLYHFYGKAAPAIRLPDSSVFGVRHASAKLKPSDLPSGRMLEPDRYCHALPPLILELYFNTSEPDEEELLYNDLMGVKAPIGELRMIHQSLGRGPLPRLSFKQQAHSYAYYGLMADFLRFCGYHGWVILIDEVELIGRLGKASRMQAYRNLGQLLGWHETNSYPLYVVCACASTLQYELWFGDSPRKRDIDNIPQLAGEKLDNAAKRKLEEFFEQAVSTHCPKLTDVEVDRVSGLLTEVAKLHGKAYGWNPVFDPLPFIKLIGEHTIRTHIRATLEKLDLEYKYGGAYFPEAGELATPSIEEDAGYFSIAEDEA